MIKNYCIKIISSVFIMLTIFMVSSSVFATELSELYSNYYTLGGSLNSLGIDVNAVKKDICTRDGLNEDDYYIGVYKLNMKAVATGEHYVFMLKSKTNTSNSSFRYSSSNKFYVLEGGFHSTYAYYNPSTSVIKYSMGGGFTNFADFPITIYSETQFDLYYNDGSKLTKIYDWQEVYDDGLTPEKTFDYDFIGVNRDKVKLVISNLDESYKFYGLVGYDKEFNVGDSFIADNYVNYFRIVNDSNKCSGYLTLGEVVKYVIVDDTDTIVDVGTIDNMANGYFLWAYEYRGGADFSFIKDGSHYWSDDLNFIWSGNNGIEYTDDQIITNIPKVVEIYDDIYSTTISGRVEDSEGNILSDTDIIVYKDQSSFKFDFISLRYHDTVILGDFGQSIGNKIHSYYDVSGIMLTSVNEDGSYIDYSDYVVRWTLDTSIIGMVDYFKLNNKTITNYYGELSGFTSNGLCGTLLFHFDLKLIYEQYKPFNFTFYVYNSNGELIHTEILSSDDIIKEQLNFDSSTSNEKDYYVTSQPDYNSGSNSNLDISDITNWDVDDYKKLLSTDNFVWEFFESILGNLPWWITVPLTILIFGIVFISLLRFIRGA